MDKPRMVATSSTALTQGRAFTSRFSASVTSMATSSVSLYCNVSTWMEGQLNTIHVMDTPEGEKSPLLMLPLVEQPAYSASGISWSSTAQTPSISSLSGESVKI